MQHESGPPPCLRQQASIVVEHLDEEVSLYRAETNDVAVLNRTAADIWELADGSSSSEQITDLLATAYGVDPAIVIADVDRVLQDLVSRGFLVRA